MANTLIGAEKTNDVDGADKNYYVSCNTFCSAVPPFFNFNSTGTTIAHTIESLIALKAFGTAEAEIRMASVSKEESPRRIGNRKSSTMIKIISSD